jgi:membrane protein DedA with SNARE-associated domain
MSASYQVGLRWGPKLLEVPMVRSRAELVGRVRTLFTRYGVLAILVGYHIGPTRALVTSIAGIARMPRLKFEAASILSASIWVADHALIGALPGTFMDADSAWLLPVTFITPAVTIVLTVMLLRALF